MNTILIPLTRALALAVALPLAAAGSPKTKAKAPNHPVNLNSATVTELMELPHVGAKTAERIIAFRKQHGGFQRPEEVMNVKGIGEKGFARLKPFLQAGSAPKAAPVGLAPR